MLNDVNDLFVLLREKDWEGMAVWLCNYVEIAPNTEAEQAKVIEFDGFLLLPIFQMHHAEASMHLLHHPQVRSVLSNACVSHHKWMVKLANTDPQAFVWGLEQGWGRVLTPRQSSFKAYETMRCYDFVGKHLREVRWKAQAEGRSLVECDAYIAGAHNAWDGWMRQTNKRNPTNAIPHSTRICTSLRTTSSWHWLFATNARRCAMSFGPAWTPCIRARWKSVCWGKRFTMALAHHGAWSKTIRLSGISCGNDIDDARAPSCILVADCVH